MIKKETKKRGGKLKNYKMVQYIYWHRVKLIDRNVYRGFKINQIVGFLEKNKEWGVLNKEGTAIEPYIKFDYLGRTIRTFDKVKDKKAFDDLIKKVKDKKEVKK